MLNDLYQLLLALMYNFWTILLCQTWQVVRFTVFVLTYWWEKFLLPHFQVVRLGRESSPPFTI